jgi:hypothetical protein
MSYYEIQEIKMIQRRTNKIKIKKILNSRKYVLDKNTNHLPYLNIVRTVHVVKFNLSS